MKNKKLMECDYKMNIENLEVGQVYKNYKVLCEQLEESTKGGDSKKAQLKEWDRYFKYDKQGYKFTIVEIYPTPKQKSDLRSDGGNNKVKYTEDIEKLILDLLVQKGNDGQVFLSKNKLLQTLKMVNENYSYGKYKPFKLSKYTNVSRDEISDFYTNSDGMLQRNLESALNRLRSKALIMWSSVLTVGYVQTFASTNEYADITAIKYEEKDEDGDVKLNFDTTKPDNYIVHRKATKMEKQDVLATERDVLDEFGFETIRDVFTNGRSDDFYKKVTDILFERFNIYLYYNSYEIVYNQEHVLDEWCEIEDLSLDADEKAQAQTGLSVEIIDRLNTNAERRHLHAPKKYDETYKMKYARRASVQYLENNRILIDTLIKPDAVIIKSLTV